MKYQRSKFSGDCTILSTKFVERPTKLLTEKLLTFVNKKVQVLCCPIAGTSNSTNNCFCWIGLGVVSSSRLLWIVKKFIASFQIHG